MHRGGDHHRVLVDLDEFRLDVQVGYRAVMALEARIFLGELDQAFRYLRSVGPVTTLAAIAAHAVLPAAWL